MKSPRRHRPADAWKAAEAYGCDMSLLEDNLRMTPQQRIQAHRSALALAERLRTAMEKFHERPRIASQAARRSSR